MTCIVGLKHKDKIYIGADSQGSSEGHRMDYQTSKLALLEVKVKKSDKSYKLGLGFTASYRMGDLLKYAFKPPKIKENQDINEYLVTAFIPKLINCFDVNDFTATKDSVKFGGTFMLGIADRLFVVYENFCVLESVIDYAAIGSGESYALGCLHGVLSTQVVNDPKTLVELAIKASSDFCTTVGGNIKVISV